MTGLLAAARRRSFLSGRFPVHITGLQAPTCSNFLPLKFTLLPEKLKEQGFETHMASPLAAPWPAESLLPPFIYCLAQVGKGHLGYMTTDHLPANRGFDTHVGCASLPLISRPRRPVVAVVPSDF